MSKMLLRALLCILSFSCINAMDYVNAMLMYKHKSWKPTLVKEGRQHIPTLEHLVQKRIAQLLLSSPINQCAIPDIFTSDNPVMKGLVVTELLKKYAHKIAAAHITPTMGGLLTGTHAGLLQFSDDGNLLAGAQRGELCVYDTQTEQHLFVRHLGMHVKVICFNHRANRLAIGARSFEDEPLLFFLNMKGKQIQDIPVEETIQTLCYGSDDKTIAVGVTSNWVHSYHKIHIFQTATGQQLYVMPVHTDRFDSIRTLCDSLTLGRLSIAYEHAAPFKIISFDGNTVYLNYKTDAWRSQPDEQETQWCVSYGPEQKSINIQGGYYMWANKRSALYDCDTGQELCNLEQKGPVNVRVFSPNGNRLAVKFKNFIQLYDCPTYEQIISELDIKQAAYLAHGLQQKEQSAFYAACKRLASYFKTSDKQQGDFKQVHESLPFTFKKMIE